MASGLIRIPGWYLEDSAKDRRKDSAAHEASGSVRLGPSYIHSIKRFKLEDLEISDTHKYAGSYFNPRVTRGVVDLTGGGSLTKFYVLEEQIPELRRLIRMFCYSSNEGFLGNPF